MAGCSLTLVFLDGELERFWRAPADTPAYRKGQADHTSRVRPRVVSDETVDGHDRIGRSVGTPDAGAVSFVLCARAVGGVLKATR